jgi:hypothetical protein
MRTHIRFASPSAARAFSRRLVGSPFCVEQQLVPLSSQTLVGVADQFVNSVAPGGLASGGASHDNSGAVTDTVHRMNMELLELQQTLDSESKKKEKLQEAIEKE